MLLLPVFGRWEGVALVCLGGRSAAGLASTSWLGTARTETPAPTATFPTWIPDTYSHVLAGFQDVPGW